MEQKVCSTGIKTELGQQTRNMHMSPKYWQENLTKRLLFQQELNAAYCISGSDGIK